MDAELEDRMYRQLKGAFTVGDSCNFRIIMVPSVEYPTMEHALTQAHGQVCFLEPTGDKFVNELSQDDLTLVVGNTEHDNLEYANRGTTWRIATPKSTDLYGINAVAIALHHWWSNR